MSGLSRSISELRLFWVAMSLIGYSTRQEDIDDVIDFVASFGERGIQEFERDLDLYHRICDTSGLTARVTFLLTQRLCRLPSDAETRASLESLAISQRHFFTSCAEDPDWIEDWYSLDSPLIETLHRNYGSMSAMPPAAKSTKKLAPLRRDGNPWISPGLGLGVGVRWNSDWPFNTLHFSSRIYKLAAICSQREDWLDLRERGRFRQVDVHVEWWRDLTGVAARVKRRSFSTLEVFVPRPVPTGDQGEDPDGVYAGDKEALIVLRVARDLIAGLNEN